LKNALKNCYELAAGGTAVGTGINAIDGFGEEVSRKIAEFTGLPFISAGGSFLVSCFIMIGLIMKMGDESIE
jgi:fumarate hydratase class II